MNYNLSNEASSDLEEIWLYTLGNWSIEQADRYLNLILDKIEYLCKKPKTGSDYGAFRKGYFRSKVKSHFIFYKINTKQNKLEIIRVLHEIMDIDSQLDK